MQSYRSGAGSDAGSGAGSDAGFDDSASAGVDGGSCCSSHSSSWSECCSCSRSSEVRGAAALIRRQI